MNRQIHHESSIHALFRVFFGRHPPARKTKAPTGWFGAFFILRRCLPRQPTPGYFLNQSATQR